MKPTRRTALPHAPLTVPPDSLLMRCFASATKTTSMRKAAVVSSAARRVSARVVNAGQRVRLPVDCECACQAGQRGTVSAPRSARKARPHAAGAETSRQVSKHIERRGGRTDGVEDEHGGERVGERAGADVLGAEGGLHGGVEGVAEAWARAELLGGAVREAGDAVGARGVSRGARLNGGALLMAVARTSAGRRGLRLTRRRRTRCSSPRRQSAR